MQSRACPSPGPHWGQPGYPHHRLGRRGKDWRNATWEKGPTSLHSLPRAAHALPGTLLSTLGPFRLKAHLPCEAERLRERHVVMSPPVGNRANEREVMPPGSWGGRGRTDPAWAGSQALLLLLTPLRAAPKTFPNFTRRPSCPHTRAFPHSRSLCQDPGAERGHQEPQPHPGWEEQSAGTPAVPRTPRPWRVRARRSPPPSPGLACRFSGSRCQPPPQSRS